MAWSHARRDWFLIKKNHAYTFVLNLSNKKIVSCKWIFKKNDEIPSVELSRYKAALGARGFIRKKV